MTPRAFGSELLFFLILIFVFIAAVIIALAWVLRKAWQAGSLSSPLDVNRESSALSPVNISSGGMFLSFSRALGFLKRHVTGRDYRYEVPWLMMLAPQGAGATAVLASAGASTVLAREGGPAFGVRGGPEWWFYERGLVINAPGNTVLRADGKTSDQAAWQALLRLLARRRSRRPLDGVVFAISVEDLLDIVDSGTGTAIADPTVKAEALRRKLSQLTRAVSMRMPVYVLVTKCDLVPGFTSFAGEYPGELQDQIFGWSNPHPLDTAFTPEWVDQCFHEMHSRIMEQQMEIFVERGQLKESDGVFLFPAEFLALRPALRQYLTSIFQSTVYEESYYFRGIYFCGDVNAPAAVRQPGSAMPAPSARVNGPAGAIEQTVTLAPPATQSGAHAAPVVIPALHSGEQTNRPVFLHDLFQRKIFPEVFLARPLRVTGMSRDRTVLAASILTAAFVLAAGVGTPIAGKRIADLKRDHLLPLFQQLAVDIRLNDDQGQNNARQRAALDGTNVLNNIAALSGNHLRSIFLPASWGGATDRHVKAALSIAFGNIVLEGFRTDLADKLADLIKATPVTATPAYASRNSGETASGKRVTTDPSASGAGNFDSFDSVPEYQSWSRYIAGLRDLETNIARYNRIATPSGGSADDLKQLLSYLKLSADLRPNIDLDDPYFVGVLQDAKNKPFDFSASERRTPGRVTATQHAADLIAGFFAEWFGARNRLAVDVRQMTASIDNFDKQRQTVAYDGLKDVADDIDLVSADLENPDYDWLSDAEFKLARFPAFDQPIDDLRYLAGFDLPQETEKYGQSGFELFIGALSGNSTRLTGPVLSHETPVQVSGSVAALRANLRTLLQQSFVSRDPGIPRRLDSRPSVWDRNTLLEAQNLFDAYTTYERGSSRSAPPAIQQALQRVALERLEDNVLDYVAQAQSVLPSGSPAETEIQNFGQSAPVFDQLLAGFAKFPNPAAARNFNSILAGQASRMLITLEQDLYQGNLYAVRDSTFDWWEGEKPLSLAAYDASGADELKEYVDKERDQVNTLAQQAAPLADFLKSRSAGLTKQEKQALVDWQAILLQLKNYGGKTPGNSVSLLEDYIRTGLDKIGPDTSCQDNVRDPLGRSDYFLTERSVLRAGALARCRVLSRRVYVTQIATPFNERLGGRFPFAATGPPNGFQEADPAGIAEFFGKFDQYGKAAAENLTQSTAAGKSRSDALTFLSQMTGIRPIFAAYLAGTDKNSAPAFNLIVNFRVNREKEIEGKQIGDWSLDVGTQTVQLRGKENTLHWSVGEPVRLTIRFADDSPSLPVQDKGQPAMIIGGRVVTFEYNDPWSLFRLLLEHKLAPAELGGGAQAANTLVFSIPLVSDGHFPQPKDGAPASQMRVYLQLILTPQGAKESVAPPLPFPATAPAIPDNQNTARGD